MLTLYGIKNCDKCRAASKWFAGTDCEFRFHDLREDGLSAEVIRDWIERIGSTELINKRSTTWRSIPESRRNIDDAGVAEQLIIEFPTLIKRPLVAGGTELIVGYDEAAWQSVFNCQPQA